MASRRWHRQTCGSAGMHGCWGLWRGSRRVLSADVVVCVRCGCCGYQEWTPSPTPGTDEHQLPEFQTSSGGWQWHAGSARAKPRSHPGRRRLRGEMGGLVACGLWINMVLSHVRRVVHARLGAAGQFLAGLAGLAACCTFAALGGAKWCCLVLVSPGRYVGCELRCEKAARGLGLTLSVLPAVPRLAGGSSGWSSGRRKGAREGGMGEGRRERAAAAYGRVARSVDGSTWREEVREGWK